jgi:hypothetical protein
VNPAWRGWYNAAMTFMTVTYELQNALKADQFRALGQFANTYGLQRFRFDEKTNRLHFDYDASRLRESVVEHVLREAKIPVLRRVVEN